MASLRTPSRRNRHAHHDTPTGASKLSYGKRGPSRYNSPQVEVVIPQPTWNTLPQELITIILRFASDSFYVETREVRINRGTSNAWLLGVACVSRNWHGPAIDVLYEAPDLVSSQQLDRFTDHLLGSALHRSYLVATPTSHISVDQQPKIRRMVLSVTDLTRRRKGNEFALEALLGKLPAGTLKELIIYDPVDTQIHKQHGVFNNKKFEYTKAIFATLDLHNHKLKHWSWNGYWLPATSRNDWSTKYEWLATQCRKECLKQLTSLELSNMHVRELSYMHLQTLVPMSVLPISQDPTFVYGDAEKPLFNGLNELQSLRTLKITFSSVINDLLIQHLPPNLEVLHLNTCAEFTSVGLSKFLADKGAGLRELRLLHNKSLELEFMTSLGKDCPKLELLIVDCHYYSTFSTSKDSYPNYDYLLGYDSVPNWPTSLQHLELHNLRGWRPNTANNLFWSLIDAAPLLTRLQKLIIHVQVDEDWRERTRLRTVMTRLIHKMFKRKTPPPSAHLNSIKAFKAWKATQVEKTEDGFNMPLAINVRKRQSKRNRAEFEDSDVPVRGRGKRAKRNNQFPRLVSPKRVKATKSTRARRADSDDEVTSKSRRQTRARGTVKPTSNTSISTRTRSQRTTKEELHKGNDKDESPKRSLRPRPEAFGPSTGPDVMFATGPRRSVLPSNDSSFVPLPAQNRDMAQRDIEHTLREIRRGRIAVQGMCDVCDVTVDNQRPTDLQFTENDFLDSRSEDESDEDFDGGDVKHLPPADSSESSESEEEEDSESEAEFTDEDS